MERIRFIFVLVGLLAGSLSSPLCGVEQDSSPPIPNLIRGPQDTMRPQEKDTPAPPPAPLRSHIDFAVQYNLPTDSDFTAGPGFWLGYRYSISDAWSFGGFIGAHSFRIRDSGPPSTSDTVTAIPLLFAVQWNSNVVKEKANTFWFGRVGVGPSINTIHGDQTDLLDIKMDPSIAIDVALGGGNQITPNFAIGGQFDFFGAMSRAHSSVTGGSEQINMGHYGFGLVLSYTF